MFSYIKTQVPRNMEQLLCIDQPPLFKCIYETFYIGKINWRKQTGVTLQLIMETFWVVGLYLKIIRTELGFLFLAKDFFVLLYCHTTLITFSDVLTIFLTQKRTESVYHPLMHNKAFPICDKFWRRKNIHLTSYFSLNTYNWVWLYPTWLIVMSEKN